MAYITFEECTDFELPTEYYSHIQHETKRAPGNFLFLTTFAGTADTPDSRNERARP
jgi:hypothetical protein